MTITAIPSMERLTEVYAEHITELGDLLRARYKAAEGAAAYEEELGNLKAQISQGIEGKNETERRAMLILSLENSTEYQRVLHALASLREDVSGLDIAIELKRLRMRLAGWQMEWIIAQNQAQEVQNAVAAERAAWKAGEETR